MLLAGQGAHRLGQLGAATPARRWRSLGTYAFAWELTAPAGDRHRRRPRAWSPRRSWRSRAGSTSATSSPSGSACSSASRLLSGLRTGRVGLGWSSPACCSAGSSSPAPTTGSSGALAFGGYAAGRRAGRWRRLVRPFLLVRRRRRCPLVAATLAYNRRVTGSPARVPHHGRRPARHLRVRHAAPHARLPGHGLHASAAACTRWPSTPSSSPGSSLGSYLGCRWSRRRACGSPAPAEHAARPAAGHRGVPAGLPAVLGHRRVVVGSPASAGRSTSSRLYAPSSSSSPSPSSRLDERHRAARDGLAALAVVATLPIGGQPAAGQRGDERRAGARGARAWPAIDEPALVFVGDTEVVPRCSSTPSAPTARSSTIASSTPWTRTPPCST